MREVSHMKQRWLVLVLLLAVCVAALGGGALAQTPQKVEVTLWHHWTGHRADWVQEMLDAFMAEHPWIEAKQMVSGTAGAIDRLTSFLIAGTSPEIVMVSSGYANQFMALGGLLSLNDLLARDGIDLDMFNGGDLRGFQLHADTYGLPVMSGAAWTNLMFYNKDMLEEVGLSSAAPATWTEWSTAARRLTKKASNGTVERAGSTIPPIHTVTYWNGDSLWTDDWRTATVGSSRTHETAQFITQLTNDIYGGYSSYLTFINSGTSFYNQQIGLWFQNNSAFGFMKNLDFEWGAALAPVNDAHEGTQATGLVTSTWGYAIPATIPDEKVEATWALLKFLATEEDGGGWFSRIQGRPSPVIEFNRHPDYIYENPAWPVVIEAVMKDIAAPPVNLWDMLVPINDRILNEAIHPQQGFEQMDLALQNALDRFWETLD